MGAIVIGKRHCGVFQDRTTAETEIVVVPNLAIRELGWFHHEPDVVAWATFSTNNEFSLRRPLAESS
jgi:hypothetical protein